MGWWNPSSKTMKATTLQSMVSWGTLSPYLTKGYPLLCAERLVQDKSFGV
ncbi:hypothetical protein TNCV_4124451 [Trichonephila clavipes]|nr:hypothetical protein TNCV_4124451 [Trichonephila clavipes]